MNPEIYVILEEMKQKQNQGPVGSSEHQIQKSLAIGMARLLVLLAEEAEAQGKRAEAQTKKVIGLTKALQILTYVLVGIGIVQIGVAIKSLF